MTRHSPALADPEIADAAEILWNYHRIDDGLTTTTDVGIGLGSHDLSVATTTAELFHAGRFPLIVFTGANAPTTVDRFPEGEAAHYRKHALSQGVPSAAILVEPTATNTGENITRTRDLLAGTGHRVSRITLVSRPYQQRRARATCRKLWPEVDVVTAGAQLSLAHYVRAIGDERRVLSMLVGDTQRITVYAERGFAAEEAMPDVVRDAMALLVTHGFTDRLL